jgi:hypothetical protein
MTLIARALPSSAFGTFSPLWRGEGYLTIVLARFINR